MCCKYGLFLLSLLVACSSVDSNDTTAAVPIGSQQTTVHGSAPITEAGIERARQAAIEEAIVNASMQLKRNKTDAFVASDIKVVDEWQDGNTYHVQALAVLSSKQQSCRASHRKRMIATAFPAMNSEQISGADSQDLYSGIPREISNRLMESGDFIVRNLSNTLLYERPDLAPEIPWFGRHSDSVLLLLAKQYNAQLVLSGVIRDFKIESTEYVRGSGVLALLKSTVRDYVARRSIGIDVYVYDGFTGALLFQQRYTDSIVGDVSLPAGYSVGSERFESNPAGHKISQIIQMASADIEQMFACYPFAARVDRVEQNRVVISAGAQDKVRVGDRLMIYSAADSASSGLGFTDPLAVMVISEVGPSMAAGHLEGEITHAIIRPGDWVRSFSAP